MSTIAETPEKATWSTWEELLLAFSVKRHGLKDWDAVAMELRSRSPFPALLTAQICREKYRDLQRRFTDGDAVADDADGGGGDVVIPWLDDLRQLRVAELRQEVHRHDLSIQSLQLKVKRMVEERERSGEERREAVIESDLAEGGKEDLPTGGGRDRSEEVAGEVVSGGSPEHENRSVNESNSAENTETEDRCKPDPVRGNPDPQKKPAGEEDSCKDSSNRREASKTTSQKSNGDDVSNDVARDGGDVESSASLTKKRRKRPQAGGGGAARSPAIVIKGGGADKSEPLIALLDEIRSHKHGTAFKRRLQIQKTDKYKRIIRRHVDLETVQARLDDGSYSSCPAKFYLDLLLLFNNAIVFFPNSSPESVAAHELRALVTKNLKTVSKKNQQSLTNLLIPAKVQPKSEPEPDNPGPLLSKGSNPRVAPIVVCRKRSSLSATAATKSIASADETSQEIPSGLDSPKRKERHATGVRSMRTGNKGRPSGKKPNKTSEDEVTDVATEKEGGGSGISSNDKKRGAANFLKRIKKSSPAKEAALPPDTTKRSPSDAKNNGKEQPKKGKGIEKKETASKAAQSGAKKSEEKFPTKKSVGRPRTRGRDAISEEHSKRPKKRAKR
ncbi:hypothetical protein DM860_004395 [Cuscuta australis]|uniref:Uncharacterized protein n=1 Tax=Cuscuta australis TaxID=267555 RepID=A0A328E7F3_9ASTE|nr:hypothetical protein DM860_004395 [Cuscuta australis]